MQRATSLMHASEIKMLLKLPLIVLVLTIKIFRNVKTLISRICFFMLLIDFNMCSICCSQYVKVILHFAPSVLPVSINFLNQLLMLLVWGGSSPQSLLNLRCTAVGDFNSWYQRTHCADCWMVNMFHTLLQTYAFIKNDLFLLIWTIK